jgi:hypothetical protein
MMHGLTELKCLRMFRIGEYLELGEKINVSVYKDEDNKFVPFTGYC